MTNETAVQVRCDVVLKAVSVTEKGAAIGFEVNLEDLGDTPTEGLIAAHQVFVESRLDVELQPGEGADQERLFEAEIKSVADCGRISAGATTLAARLSFDRKSVDLDALMLFAGKKAVLSVRRVGVSGGTRTAEDGAEALDPETGESVPVEDARLERAGVVHAGAAT